jgi:hypothetical protein
MEGLVWRIGDGQRVKVWEDKWIPREITAGHHPNKNVNMVSELLLPDGGGWNEEKLREVLFDVHVEDILKIPVGRLEQVIISHGITPKTGSFLSNRHTISRPI